MLMTRTERAVGLVLPTGCGKSLVYVSYALMTHQRMVVLTSTRGLQDQLLHDFAKVGLADLRGQAHYECVETAPGKSLQQFGKEVTSLYHAPRTMSLTVLDGPCHSGVPCVAKFGGCPYYDAVYQAQQAPLVVTTYAYWLAHPDPDHFGVVDVLCLDEAHHAPDELSHALALTLHETDLRRVDVPWPHAHGTDWAGWADDAQLVIREALKQVLPPVTKADLTRAQALTRLLSTVTALGKMDSHWVIEAARTPKGRVLTAIPVSPAAWAESHLLRGTPKVLLTSATLTQKTVALLGLEAQTVLWSADHRVPVAQRPVIHVPTVRMRHDMPQAAKFQWVSRIDQIIGPRIDRKGIIHTVSYNRRDLVLANSAYRTIMLTHDGTRELAEVVKVFKKMDPPAILVSPSLITGYDFPYDTCRYQIIGKIPMPDPRNALMVARSSADPDYAWHLALQAMIQAVGRGVRAQDDWCETFVIDDLVVWMMRRYRHLIPAWFLLSYGDSSIIPSPFQSSTGR